nr:MAG TPA: hypothetical protein [Caudoviricetes sp.]
MKKKLAALLSTLVLSLLLCLLCFFSMQLLIEVLISGSDVIFLIFLNILTSFCVYGFLLCR